MQFDFGELYAKEHLAEKGQKLRVFGNLPYNISTPLMFHLFKYHDVIQDIALHAAKRSSQTVMRRTK